MADRKALAWLALLGALVVAGPSRADDRSEARAEYERGRKAHAGGRFGDAARAFAHADDIVPSAVALHAAIDDAVQAGDGALALDLCDRADARGDQDADLRASVTAARTRFAELLAQRHPPPPPDPVPAPPPPAVTTPPVTPVVPPPAARVAPAPEASRGLSPAVFWVGVGVTGVLAAGAIGTQIATASTHGTFQDEGCDVRGQTDDCADLARRGKTLQAVGLGLVIGTAAAGLGTAALGLFAVDFSRHTRVSVAPTVGGGVAFATVSF